MSFFKKNTLKAFLKIIKNRFFHSAQPVALRWNITNKCVFDCAYCNMEDKEGRHDLAQVQISNILKNITKFNFCRVSLSGGEPFLSDYFSLIVNDLYDKNISVIMNSTGAGIERCVDVLNKIDLIQFSYDGPEHVMMMNRDKRAYSILLSAMSTAEKEHVNYSLCTTLTKYNADIDIIEQILNFADEHNTLVAFQPLQISFLDERTKEMIPDSDKYKQCIEYLYEQKRSGRKVIRNSSSHIKHIMKWPVYSKDIFCKAGELFYFLDSSGILMPCDRSTSCTSVDFTRDDLNRNDISLSARCNSCGFCGSYEVTMASRFYLDVLFEIKALNEIIAKK